MKNILAPKITPSKHAADVAVNIVRKKPGRFKPYVPIYLMLIPIMIWFFVFKILPIYGIQMAFKEFMPMKGIWDSPWVGLQHFKTLFSSYYFTRILSNTLIISLLRIVTTIPAAIIFALLLNEIRSIKFKRLTQTISYLPYFISWVTAAGLFIMVLSPQFGLINKVITSLGGKPIYFLGESDLFRGTIIVTGIWKSLGWDSIIYLAALSGINPEYYEAASIDGASRFQRVWHISLPCVMPTIVMLVIINIGSVLSAGFDQIVNLYNTAVYSTGDIIDTYVFREGFINSNYGFSTAVGLFKSVIAFIMVIGANLFARKTTEQSLW